MRVEAKQKNKVWLTHDGFLCLSAGLEELMESEGAGGHSEGILMWDPPTTEGRRLYSSWCGPDPPDHCSILIGYRTPAHAFLFGTWPLGLCCRTVRAPMSGAASW